MPETPPRKNILLIGASRGLGYAMAAEYMKHGWNVVGIAPKSTVPTRSGDNQPVTPTDRSEADENCARASADRFHR